MKISPYLENMLFEWGKSVKWRPSTWYSSTPYLEEWVGRSTRSNILINDDKIDELAGRIVSMNMSLQKALKAKFAHKLKTDKFRANWCRMSITDYRLNLNEAIIALESWLCEDQ